MDEFKGSDFVNVCFVVVAKNDPAFDHRLERDRILRYGDDELKKKIYPNSTLRPTPEEQKAEYSVLGKCLHAQPELALQPPQCIDGMALTKDGDNVLEIAEGRARLARAPKRFTETVLPVELKGSKSGAGFDSSTRLSVDPRRAGK